MMLGKMTSGTVLTIAALSLSVGWMAGRSTAPSQSAGNSPSARERVARPAADAGDVAPFTGQLRKRLEAQPPRTPATGRNPFVFGSSRPVAVSRYREEPMAAPAPPPEAVIETPPVPLFKLSGIAASDDAGAMVLTAIINDHGAMVFAKAGDQLSAGATVVSVSETAVVIIDSAGITQTIRFP